MREEERERGCGISCGPILVTGGVSEEESARQFVGVRASARMPSGVMVSIYVSQVHAGPLDERGIAIGALDEEGEKGGSAVGGGGGGGCSKTRMTIDVSSMNVLRFGNCFTCSGVLLSRRLISLNMSSMSPVAM